MAFQIVNRRLVTPRDRVGLSVAQENAQAGNASGWAITGAGATTNVGFAREFSVNVGETVNFSCTGSGTVIDVYRIGYYSGAGWRLVTTLTNSATTQPDPVSISNSNGGTTCVGWSTTASWAVPVDATSGLYVGVYRNSGLTDASWIPFVVRDDARVADVIVKTSDATWGVAYNSYGTPAAPTTGGGRDFYGANFTFGIGSRCHANTWMKPMVTRSARTETYWYNAEAPLIRWLERNGYNVKYVSCKDLDTNPAVLDNGKIIISSGHDEYWSQGMRDNVEAFRDAGGHLLFMSGNEAFWRTRRVGDNLWCYKDTMDGPDAHVGGVALDPVSWTGTWKDTRSANNATRAAENTLTGTDFRMNGIRNDSVTFSGSAGYASHPVWRNTVVASGSDVSVTGIIGFEADEMLPTRPGPVTLASRTFNIDGWRADNNGQVYTGNGSLAWGVVSQRWPSGAVVVGFGTCQWAWGLDDAHDNGAAYANTAMRQFTYNLLRDLGAAPETMQSGLTASSPSALTAYGSTA